METLSLFLFLLQRATRELAKSSLVSNWVAEEHGDNDDEDGEEVLPELKPRASWNHAREAFVYHAAFFLRD